MKPSMNDCQPTFDVSNDGFSMANIGHEQGTSNTRSYSLSVCEKLLLSVGHVEVTVAADSVTCTRHITCFVDRILEEVCINIC